MNTVRPRLGETDYCGCSSNSAGSFKKSAGPGARPTASDLIGLGYSSGIRIFKSSCVIVLCRQCCNLRSNGREQATI